jgi:hypothetical protein
MKFHRRKTAQAVERNLTHTPCSNIKSSLSLWNGVTRRPIRVLQRPRRFSWSCIDVHRGASYDTMLPLISGTGARGEYPRRGASPSCVFVCVGHDADRPTLRADAQISERDPELNARDAQLAREELKRKQLKIDQLTHEIANQRSEQFDAVQRSRKHSNNHVFLH